MESSRYWQDFSKVMDREFVNGQEKGDVSIERRIEKKDGGGMIVYEKGSEPLSTRIHDSILKKLESKDNDSFIVNDSGEKFLIGISEIKLTKGKKGFSFGGTFESIDHKKGNTGESWYIL